MTVSFENFVLDDRRPLSSRLILGCDVVLFWTELRSQDLQRTPPTRISLTEGVPCAVCELSKTGQPQPAACLAGGFTSHSFSSGWGYTWFESIQEWINTIRKCSLDLHMVFFLKYKEKDAYKTIRYRDQCYIAKRPQFYDMLQNNLLWHHLFFFPRPWVTGGVPWAAPRGSDTT